ncbi:EAL domain-containing protein [Vibrio sp. D431a]|uniref:EAL domain-containing protein n=1 Tax=Vibrio sp. D431a TaxID=2837388 RepID=UPI002555FB71|nr:EAL domain-containing protein [Vibrio sp. D431a]MDK9793869.1 EAL domain-containing protein [Vibrio sp. D431a]
MNLIRRLFERPEITGLFHKYMNIDDKSKAAIIEKLNTKNNKMDDFYAVFQPKYDARTLSITGFEALCRWEDPELGTIPPSLFIPIAEETGSIHEIGAFMLEKTIAFISKYSKENNSNIVTSVNLSPAQLHANRSEKLVKLFVDLIEKYKISPSLLQIELTETETADDITGIAGTIETIQAMGIGLAIDDFGTGHSSVSRVLELNVDTIKLDRSIVNQILSEKGELLCLGLITTFHSLEMEIVAEGVENKQQLEKLRELSCDTIQGYYLGRPISESAALSLV